MIVLPSCNTLTKNLDPFTHDVIVFLRAWNSWNSKWLCENWDEAKNGSIMVLLRPNRMFTGIDEGHPIFTIMSCQWIHIMIIIHQCVYSFLFINIMSDITCRPCSWSWPQCSWCTNLPPNFRSLQQGSLNVFGVAQHPGPFQTWRWVIR